MASNKGKILRELMAARGKGQSSKAPAKSQTSVLPPTTPQIPADLGLKVNPNLKKKRSVESLEEGKVGPRQGSKQQKTTQEHRDKRAPFVESQEEMERAEVCVPPRTWSPRLEVDGVAIPYNASIREYNRGREGDIEAYRRFSQSKLFLSLKRELAMITQQVFVAKEWCRDNRKLADVEALSRAKVEKALGALKLDHYELSEKLKEAESGCKSAEAGLKTAEKQADDQRQKLYVTETNLATEKQAVLDLKAALQKAKEEARLAKEEAQLVKEAAEAEKRAAYQLGVEETEARLSEELPEVCRDYGSISWAQALNAAGIPADSALRLLEKVAVRVEDVEEEKGKGKGKGKKTSSKAKDLAKEAITEAEDHGAGPQVKDVPSPQPEQKEDPPAES
ncbi:uncharacterized protein LOC126728309 [Quercus robur]|uniref:uncharacterized protein LOC126728309 n=1 Tax=Quercus robur TaxID=38942 RepID=UPI002163FE06|nr:uncharacterized protein LOC126728309 [Quercus robur]